MQRTVRTAGTLLTLDLVPEPQSSLACNICRAVIMILEHLSALNQKHIVLASASPRRAELLRQIGLTSFEIIPSK